MIDEGERRKDQNEDRPNVKEVVSEFDDVLVKSGFEIEQTGPDEVSVNIFGPVFEFLDDDEGDDEAEGGREQS
jgi:hypothetical protein